MLDPMPKKSARAFSKRIVVTNMILVWALMFLAVVLDQAEHVISGGFALIGVLFGVYAGVGHMDFRKAVELSFDRLITGSRSNGEGG